MSLPINGHDFIIFHQLQFTMISVRVTLVVIAIVALAHSLEHFKKVFFKNVQSNSETRIVNGSAASRYEYPFQISYQVNGTHYCGGSILTTSWVLTAAHCLVGNPEDNLVIAGLLSLGIINIDAQIKRIAQQIRHPQFTGGVAANDIGLIEISSPFYWTQTVQPVLLPQENQNFNGYAWVSGWGYLDPTETNPPVILQEVQLNILSYFNCADRLTQLTGQSAPLDHNMVCATGSSRYGQTICNGDDGGPMQKNRILVGVASWTLNPCGTPGAPSVFTKVSNYLPFIRQYASGI